MRLLLDMNLSPAWAPYLRRHGFEAEHWSRVGASTARDEILLNYCRSHSAVLITRDLDFGALLAASGDTSPSVLLLRATDLDPGLIGSRIVDCLTQLAAPLRAGALVVFNEKRSKLRLLPIRPES